MTSVTRVPSLLSSNRERGGMRPRHFLLPTALTLHLRGAGIGITRVNDLSPTAAGGVMEYEYSYEAEQEAPLRCARRGT